MDTRPKFQRSYLPRLELRYVNLKYAVRFYFVILGQYVKGLYEPGFYWNFALNGRNLGTKDVCNQEIGRYDTAFERDIGWNFRNIDIIIIQYY